MQFQDLVTKAKEVREQYVKLNDTDGHNPWGVAEYMQGFMGDVGDLAKLIMAKNNYRHHGEVDQKLAHELGDCLWSLIIIADRLGIDLEKSFLNTMEELKQRIQ